MSERTIVRLDRIYTRRGDAGETSTGDGRRVAKNDPRIELCGEIDELNAALGLVLAADVPASGPRLGGSRTSSSISAPTPAFLSRTRSGVGYGSAQLTSNGSRPAATSSRRRSLRYVASYCRAGPRP
jgi:cobalamin adenosyltransferase